MQPFSKGSHRNDGASWMGDKTLEDFKSFDELMAICRQTLLLVKVSSVRAAIRKMESLIDEGAKTNSIFDKRVVDNSSAETVMKDLLCTKLVGTLAKVMGKEGADGETVRPLVRAELQEFTKKMTKLECVRLEGAFRYEALLPACLRAEVAAVLAMKWRR